MRDTSVLLLAVMVACWCRGVLHGAAMGEGEREQRSDMHRATAGGEKQGGEAEGSRAETPRVAEFIPTAVVGKAVFLGARLRSQSQRAAPGHTPGLPRNTVSYNANEKQRLKA